MFTKWVEFLILVLLIQMSRSQRLSCVPANYCKTPDGERGNCILVKKCEFVLNMIINRGSDHSTQRRLRSYGCGFDNNIPKVCCPISEKRSKEIKLLRAPECGLSRFALKRVVGGEDAEKGQFPWATALGYRNRLNPKIPKWLCGGSLITYKHVLTAGHCVFNRADLYLARFGEHNLYSDEDGASPVDIEIKHAKLHEEYDSTRYTNDIAIIILKNPVDHPDVWPVCLPFYEPYRSKSYVGDRPLVIGWGSLYFNGPSSHVLQFLQLPVVSNELCKEKFQSKAIIDKRIVCAGYMEGGKDACKGDSGGPLMKAEVYPANSSLTVYHQIGIVSYGFKCAERGYPGVYTSVSKFVDWIQSKIKGR